MSPVLAVKIYEEKEKQFTNSRNYVRIFGYLQYHIFTEKFNYVLILYNLIYIFLIPLCLHLYISILCARWGQCRLRKTRLRRQSTYTILCKCIHTIYTYIYIHIQYVGIDKDQFKMIMSATKPQLATKSIGRLKYIDSYHYHQ